MINFQFNMLLNRLCHIIIKIFISKYQILVENDGIFTSNNDQLQHILWSYISLPLI